MFASIDSLGDGSAIDPGAFDHVILDEAHHAAADSWEKLLDRVAPKELLGLTGTPERADGPTMSVTSHGRGSATFASGTPFRTRSCHFAITCSTWKAPTSAT